MRVDEIITIDYTNWRGERRERHVRPIGIQFTCTEHHPEKQWLMWGLEKKDNEEVLRAYAMVNIHGYRGMDER